MFLKDIYITFMESCVADQDKIRLKARMTDDICQVMPYLKSVISNAFYNNNEKILTFTRDFRLMVLYREEMTMAKALNQTDALQVLGWLRDLINETWENRDNIKPDYELKRKPTASQIHGLLPRTNCKECGQISCFAFAFQVLQGKQQLENCKPLFTPEYAELRETIAEVLRAVL